VDGREKRSSQRFRRCVDGLGGVALLNGGDDPRQVLGEKGRTSEGLAQLALGRGCEDRAVGGDTRSAGRSSPSRPTASSTCSPLGCPPHLVRNDLSQKEIDQLLSPARARTSSERSTVTLQGSDWPLVQAPRMFYSSPENRSQADWRVMPSASPMRAQLISRALSAATW
jgi:hypothetical protein